MSAVMIRPSQGCTAEEVAAAVAAISTYLRNGRPGATLVAGRTTPPAIPREASSPAAATGRAMESSGTERRPKMHGRIRGHPDRTPGG